MKREIIQDKLSGAAPLKVMAITPKEVYCSG